jgi:N-acetylglucosamine kinase-like BadF-type ATPase
VSHFLVMSLYLCVDCGGSKTSAVICDINGKVLGSGRGGPSNYAYLTLDAFLSAVAITVNNALKACSLTGIQVPGLPLKDTSPFAAAWFGVSGVDSPSAIASLTPPLAILLAIPEGPRLVVANDTHLLAAPVRLHPDISHAVTVIGGTGSITVSFRDVEGRLEELGRLGGWGWILGDEGGGFHVGREAIRGVLMEHDRSSVSGLPAKSILKSRLLEHFGITDVMELLTIVHYSDPSPNTTFGSDSPRYLREPREQRLSSLSPLVFATAFDDGDLLALRILRECADHLASLVAVLLGNDSDTRSRLVRAQDSIITFGGSLVGVEKYRTMILDNLAEKGHVFRYVEFVNDAAVVGAIGLAAAARTSTALRS